MGSMIQYRLSEKPTGGYLCCVMKEGELFGEVFECVTIEQAFAWLRLMMGDYPGTAPLEAV